MADVKGPWNREGLAFECTRCGACCTGAPGFVWVNADEIAKLAEFLGMDQQAFSRRYVRRVSSRYSLVEKPGGDCIFWSKDAGCTVYSERPVQCRTWPFWAENIESRQAWERTQRGCPGAGRGQWFSLEEIEAAAARTPE
jgi:uncharacterized protein